MTTFPRRVAGPQPKPSKAARLKLTAILERAARGRLTKLYAYVYKRDGYRCVACRRVVVPNAVDELKRAHPHHIVPRARASKALVHTKENICSLCPMCHADVTEHRLTIVGNAEASLTIRRLT
jgi:5-methylcytosine-specific restriction endonuclease McrA